jgi:deoxyribose-phosphate aldolase
MGINARTLASMIDHTLLAPEATEIDISKLCADAVELGVGAVCVSPSHVGFARGLLPPSIKLASVVGFPSGAHRSDTKADEAFRACESGATEIDVVINLGFVFASDWRVVTDEVIAVKESSRQSFTLKVIIESAALSDEQIVATCEAAVLGGADFVKTSTGFHKTGGATTHDVALMRATVGPSIGVKASGGIRNLAQAMEMIEAGANRIGTSSSRAILEAVAGDLN